MSFLKEVLNIDAREYVCENSFPNYIISRYRITCAYLDELEVFFIYPKLEIESITMLKKHIQKIRQNKNIPIVVILSKITARERKKFIKANIPFIVKDKQCYLPFLGTLLTERCDYKLREVEKLMPSAQVLLFYFIYHKAEDMYLTDVCDNLDFSAMTISRAVKELEEILLITSYKDGVKKVISSELSAKELFEKAKPYLSSPVKRRQYIFKDNFNYNFVIAGGSALSVYSMLNPPYMPCYAVKDNDTWRESKDEILINEKNQMELEIWKYKPCVFKEMDIDVLSVVMSYENSYDTRIEEAITSVLAELWRRLDG